MLVKEWRVKKAVSDFFTVETHIIICGKFFRRCNPFCFIQIEKYSFSKVGSRLLCFHSGQFERRRE